MTLTYNAYEPNIPKRGEGRISYEGAVRDMGLTVLQEENVGSYRGDIYMVVTDGKRFGWLAIAYGSCSGCDWLYAEESFENVFDEDGKWIDSIEYLPDEFYLELAQMVGWGTQAEVKAYVLEEKDWGVWDTPTELLEWVKNWEENTNSGNV